MEFSTNDYFQDFLQIDHTQEDELVNNLLYEASTTTKVMRHLSNYDYSLNSALVSDELDALLSWLKGGQAEPRWFKPDWKIIKQLLADHSNFRDIKPTSTFTEWFGHFNLTQPYKPVKRFNDILQRANSCSISTRPVVDSFLKGILGKSLNWQGFSHLNVSTECLKWGSLFWELHIISLLLNCTTSREANLLSESTSASIIHVPNVKHQRYLFKLLTKNFGEAIVGLGVVYFGKLKRLLDRNTILMMKDTYVARFNTLFTLSNRMDGLYGYEAQQAITKFYRMGDQILTEGGTKAYQSIKLIEPLCNNRLANLSQQFRPLIPIFKDFERHIKKSVEEAAEITPSINSLYQTLEEITDFDIILTLYGSFRHWGHPYIDYFAGLQKLYEQVTLPKQIDKKYAELLASDLAFLVIKDQFKTKKWWPVDPNSLDKDHPLRNYIENNTWPNNSVINNFGPYWHKLPLIKCFEIPDVVDPSIIYSDKSHSLTRSEMKAFLAAHPNSSIPSHKVLSSLLSNPSTNWPIFLDRVNKHGISLDNLIIGLKEKERELKIGGRFFALMSWEIRDYFVMTEYLIKTHFVPLFDGLTMADDLTTVIGKILRNTEGQGDTSYENVTFADHIDYEKWNNHQRAEGNNPTFRVMGQFLGYPNLIERTHEIFEKSWIYYNRRGDLIGVDDNDKLYNKGPHRVCWNGQRGGLEGLRQKGWSIVNLLILKRESLAVNTDIKVLAQGDNQVICSRYRLRQSRNDNQLLDNLNDVSKNNKLLMGRIAKGTEKLGLIINHDETMKSTEFLNYGKTCVIRGNIRNLETKRWSRVTCVTNDQLPTMANVLSTTSSNSLTVSHFSDSPINPIVLYNFYGHFVRTICEFHNPALRGPVSILLTKKDLKRLDSLFYLVSSLYLDPSIGGVCGMSLTRFLIRVFPDPITESLSFLKIVHDNTYDPELREIMCQLGNPKVRGDHDPDISKLLEDPLSLNIPRGIDATNMIKEKIKKSLSLSADKIQNLIISKAVQHQVNYELTFLNHLKEIEPLFPRFLSEYRSASYFGIIDSIVGLFQNSKTIRNQFKGHLSVEYDSIIIKSEIYSIRLLLGLIRKPEKRKGMWSCSSSQADFLREISWGRKVYGATVPHPAEFLNIPKLTRGSCHGCDQEFPHYLYLSVLIPIGFQHLKTAKGSCSAYLGSSTLESTSILQHWEKETRIPLLKRAASLRNAIGWFVDPDSNLARSILNNLYSLTGESWDDNIKGFKRTGSALHRFNCSRQSNGGYTAQNPSKLTRMISTTNSFAELGSVNYDFMYQSCLLHALLTVGEVHSTRQGQGFYHVHIKCRDCLREIEEITLNCPAPYRPEEVYQDLEKWKPDNVSWSLKTPIVNIRQGHWDTLEASEKSYHVGIIQGFIFGDSIWGRVARSTDPALFPLTIGKHVVPRLYMEGLLIGMVRSSILSITHQRLVERQEKYHSLIIGNTCLIITELAKNQNVLNIWREVKFQTLFASVSHRLSPSYPMIEVDIGYSGANYLIHLLINLAPKFLRNKHVERDESIWIFSDTYRFEIVALIAVSEECWRLLLNKKLDKEVKHRLKMLREVGSWIRTLADPDDTNLLLVNNLLSPLCYTDREVRHAVKGLQIEDEDDALRQDNWSVTYNSKVLSVAVSFTPDPALGYPMKLFSNLRFQNPLISGLRTIQLATGSHYKLGGILKYAGVNPRGALCGGDGSGGITALVMRMFPSCQTIFNSLCDYKDVRLRGNSPSPPSAIVHASCNPGNCVNYKTNWQNPNDLSQRETWEYFIDLTKQYCLILDLIILDMEVKDPKTIDLIESLSLNYFSKIGAPGSIMIFKTYLTRIFGSKDNILNKIQGRYTRVEVLSTSISSSQTSEVYILIGNQTNSSTYLDIYPDLSQLQLEIQSYPLFSSPLQEFMRAIEVDKQDLIEGVPPNIRPDPTCELLSVFQKLHIRSDLCHRFADTYGNKPKSPMVPFHLFVLCVHGLIPFTTGSVFKQGPPSDGVCLKVSSLIAGFLIWMGLKMKNYQITKLGQGLIDRYAPFYSESIKHGNYYFQSFSFINEKKHRKILQLDSEMALIGSIIRVFQLNYPNAHLFPDINTLEQNWLIFNKAITYSWFDQMTDLIKYIRKDKKALNQDPTPKVSLLNDKEEVITKETTYRD
ncbi:RNA-dependent RNA polymerase [Wuhan Louse Fly Virus 9]|uniref:Replicase n=1 Tax=Wuhan Louse Fly Virus 9 TaxID=1608123 RepID=A0A0B5KTQ0_9RHAB|nr:RNA-dependent RNA polymerase [Wuhan Louse Fly Virus 9]AJG39207.1 RNA-dependent RNA polymerase [Wuhan Louse Fly Virus 9]